MSIHMTGYRALGEHAAWLDLSNRGTIRVSGDDRARLLHAMCTNNINDLRFGDGLYVFFLNAQGRILADAYVYHLGETFLLDTEPETHARLHRHLENYVIAEDVTLEDETGNWAIIGLEGGETRARAAELAISIPEKKYCWHTWDEGFVVHVASTGGEGVRIFIPSEEKPKLVERLEQANILRATSDEARVVRLERGIPRYGEDITERNLVQETGITDAVHFNKGCYLGQEIVERVRSRAHLNRLLTPIHISGTAAPAPGTKLSVDGKDVAEITSAAYSPALGEVVGLAYMRTEVARAKPGMIVAGHKPLTAAYVA